MNYEKLYNIIFNIPKLPAGILPIQIVNQDKIPCNYECLRLFPTKKNIAEYIIQQLSLFGYWTEDEDLLQIRDKSEDGWTLAHEQANRGWTTTAPFILKLTTNNGTTVKDLMSYHNKFYKPIKNSPSISKGDLH